MIQSRDQIKIPPRIYSLCFFNFLDKFFSHTFQSNLPTLRVETVSSSTKLTYVTRKWDSESQAVSSKPPAEQNACSLIVTITWSPVSNKTISLADANDRKNPIDS